MPGRFSINMERFCQEIVNPENNNIHSKAYRIAYPKSKKWKDNSVHRKAYDLMQNVKILARIKELRKQLEDAKIADIKEIAEGLTCDIRFDPRRLFDEDGNPKAIPDLDDDTALALAGHEVIEVAVLGKKTAEDEQKAQVFKRRLKYKYADKIKARELLGKYHGMFERDNAQRKPNQRIAIINYFTDKNDPPPGFIDDPKRLEPTVVSEAGI